MRGEALKTDSFKTARRSREGDTGAGSRSRRQRVFGYFWLSKSDRKEI